MDDLLQQKNPELDWPRARIVAELHVRKISMRQLSLHYGLAAKSLQSVLDRSWPKAEQIVAAAIGVSPETIWPQRYAKRNFKPVFPVLSVGNSTKASQQEA